MMAAYNYYSNSNYSGTSQDYNEPPRTNLRPPFAGAQPMGNYDSYDNQDSSPASRYGAATPAPSYHSTEQRPPMRDRRHYPRTESENSQWSENYSDEIPLQPSKLKTPLRNEWTGEESGYPPSPESQQASGLVPHPTPMKTGFFSGRIPWVVYVVSLVQITVFIVEIVKNCEL